MADLEPVTTVNLDQYGGDALPWSAIAERLATVAAAGRDVFTVLGTVTPDGRPHAAPVGSLWIDGAWYVVTGPDTQKGRNLTHNPACTLAARLDGVDVVFTGHTDRVTDGAELERVAAAYRGSAGPPRSRTAQSLLRTPPRVAARRPGISTGSSARVLSASGPQPM